VLLTRSPLYSRPFRRTASFAFDLHVLGTPPAFILSQDQTLRRVCHSNLSIRRRKGKSRALRSRPGVSSCAGSRTVRSLLTDLSSLRLLRCPVGHHKWWTDLKFLLCKNFTVSPVPCRTAARDRFKEVLRTGECEALAPSISPGCLAEGQTYKNRRLSLSTVDQTTVPAYWQLVVRCLVQPPPVSNSS
jgi:hypothetical protein